MFGPLLSLRGPPFVYSGFGGNLGLRANALCFSLTKLFFVFAFSSTLEAGWPDRRLSGAAALSDI